MTRRNSRTLQLVAGVTLSASGGGGYVLMHVFFFGVPNFDIATAAGTDGISYLASALVLVGIGIWSIWQGTKAGVRR